jgi:hypothetical protein
VVEAQLHWVARVCKMVNLKHFGKHGTKTPLDQESVKIFTSFVLWKELDAI